MSEGPCRHSHGRSGATIPFPHGASPQQRVPTLRVLIVTVCAAAVAGELALEGPGPGQQVRGVFADPRHLTSTPLSFSPSLPWALGMLVTVWRLPSWEHDSSGEEGVKGTAEADTPFRI